MDKATTPLVDFRIGDWIETYTGRKFWPIDPDANDVDIEDIAHALSNMCRYAGHTTKFYSVAQHSVLVASQVSKENRLTALLHDATEAYLVDVPRPIKPYLKGYERIEQTVWEAIATKFDLPFRIPDEVKFIDRKICLNEQRDVFNSKHKWNIEGPMLNLKIHPVSPDRAKTDFLEQFHLLTSF